jgi:hypothetical protein
MGDKSIFSDADRTVRVERNPRMKDPRNGRESIFNGIVYTITCQDCEVPLRVGITWNEVRQLLDGGSLHGVVRVEAGWQIVAQCGNSNEGCERKNVFLVTDIELENEANMELSRRARVAKAQQSGQFGR